MSTATLERPDTSTKTETGRPDMFHYVKKVSIAESAVMGNLVQALCGEVFPVTKAPKSGSPVCPECEQVYDQMKRD